MFVFQLIKDIFREFCVFCARLKKGEGLRTRHAVSVGFPFSVLIPFHHTPSPSGLPLSQGEKVGNNAQPSLSL